MLAENVLVRPIGENQASIYWTSDTTSMRSWVFINGRFVVGPFMAENKERNIQLLLPEGTTFLVEIHDFDDDTVPASTQESPLVLPTIGWNSVEDSSTYRIYHTIFDGGEMESLLCEVPPTSGRMEIDSPIKLEGRGGRWHSFRVEAVDQYGNESENEVVAHFAADFPKPPTLSITRDTVSGLLNFRIL